MSFFKHESIEINAGLLIALTMVVISIGGLVEIVPLFYIKNTIEKVEGVRPYTPLELRGRDIYQREGCYLCHSQMIRPFRDEMLRYGHYSLAAESQYDHPFQWGSKRTGPDLARVGGKYSNEWHVAHMINPRDVVPESIMPSYPWLMENELEYSDVADRMRALKKAGVPYSETREEYQANVEKFGREAADRLNILAAEQNLIAEAQAGNFDGDRARLTEMDALVAYLQMLGTLVDFSQYEEGHFAEFR
ncbi:cytochrome c oxidase, cbb3-type subunit II [Thiohalobacter sp. COW1]|uniref:Cytochrome c oxidase cbb3-type subunit II n=1 Tax=Thiohalobacter thiocyanaticus TaxID=585455 RepID=A0A1Z4VLF5_9GAMM|nr:MULTISPECIES: cytochrome-c oxidase, cbb3-type subunit II [Thiohalobacter]BAZ92429.1 cytochrome c oxidase cbb3-type subunit II [Thiohalobacter thiocyanaticus]BCO32586.1 cytochrome c oxidase, cbb3-type subunit II [Thiohalobacter sp. COW1]